MNDCFYNRRNWNRKKVSTIALLTIVICCMCQLSDGSDQTRSKQNPSAGLFAEVRLQFKKELNKPNEIRRVPLRGKGETHYLTVFKKEVPAGVEMLDIIHPFARAETGEEGFYVFSNGMYGEFKDRGKNGFFSNKTTVMPFYAFRTVRGAMAVLLTGMRYDGWQCVSLDKGVYRIFSRFPLDGEIPYEDISLEYHRLSDKADYSEAARWYRTYQLGQGIVRPLKERIKTNSVLAYAVDSIEVRVRHGWKPVPSPVPEQNAQNEPEMFPAITFDRLADIIREFKKQGIDKAELCLVGWNIGGHDGRYPQIFPVDPRLGGEEKLRKTITLAKENGFQICAHVNNSDAYHASEIGGLWDPGYLLVRKDGQFNTYTTYGGGQMFETCPQCMFERFVKQDNKKLSDLGFRGLHYIDVYSTVNPRTCYSKEHPLTREEFAQWTNRIFAEAQQTFGGLGSEGGYDYCAGHLDYALNITFWSPEGKLSRMIDRYVPIWHLVYNGIILNNPFRTTWNHTIQKPLYRLKLIEFGGRPLFYFYRNFKNFGKDPNAVPDITCATDQELTESVKKIKEGYDEFQKLRYLQLEFMNDHQQIAPDVFKTIFSDGTIIIVNYSDKDFYFENKKVGSMSCLAIKNGKTVLAK